MPEPHPYQEAHLPFLANEPHPPTPPIPWSQHTCQYSSIEYLADQKLDNVSSTPETDSPMSDAYPESTIVIPPDWPSQQLIPEPSHVPSPQPMSFDAYPVAPSQCPLLEVTIPKDPLSPASSLGKYSTSPSSVISQLQYSCIWNPKGLIHKPLPIYDSAHTIVVPHARSPSQSAMGSPETSPDASPSLSEPTISASILNPAPTSPIGYMSPWLVGCLRILQFASDWLVTSYMASLIPDASIFRLWCHSVQYTMQYHCSFLILPIDTHLLLLTCISHCSTI